MASLSILLHIIYSYWCTNLNLPSVELISCRPSTYPFVFLRLTLLTNGEYVAILPLSIIHLVLNSNGLLQTSFHFVLTSWSMIIKPTPSCCWKYPSLQLGQTNTSIPTHNLLCSVFCSTFIVLDRNRQSTQTNATFTFTFYFIECPLNLVCFLDLHCYLVIYFVGSMILYC